MLDIGPLAVPMTELSAYPYLARRVLLCRQDIAANVIGAVVDVLATDASQLVPPYVSGT